MYSLQIQVFALGTSVILKTTLTVKVLLLIYVQFMSIIPWSLYGFIFKVNVFLLSVFKFG